MVRLYLVRHGRAAASFAEARDPVLAPEGRAQAAALAGGVAPARPPPVGTGPTPPPPPAPARPGPAPGQARARGAARAPRGARGARRARRRRDPVVRAR